jgi:RNA recognition motif-containing protein
LEKFFDTEAINKIKLPKYQDTGRCLGYAHIAFKDQASYESALLKNGKDLGPRYINVNPAKGEK